jgi:hypothetical protein
MTFKNIYIICVSIVCGSIAVAFYFGEWGHGARVFAEESRVLDKTVQEENLLLRLPAQGNNEIRQELDIILNQVLTGEMDDAARLRLAALGVEKGQGIKRTLEEILLEQEKNTEAFRSLKERARHVQGLRLRWTAARIVREAKEHQKLSLEVSKILQAMHAETQGIFEQIIADSGALTPELISRLNNSTAAAEVRFNRLGDLYRDLESVSKKTGVLHERFEEERGFYLFR